ncbi:hypothetical protein [Thiohalocapsa sp. ML1]|uniref:hypothetical protein n=1 Tax=Thiohalocapsa sp. ML1 TaxID=1431688 RepID=UPI0012E330C8|nr:hypothetical protein [Thiohalocapsa sp. ML1]
MYCEDSHGTDIEHFRPKTPFPECLFVWTNMLLCCAECGRLKGKQFPTDAMGEPLLIDPTVDAPWEHLDFDPETGNVVARFDLERNAFCPKGEKTVETLHSPLSTRIGENRLLVSTSAVTAASSGSSSRRSRRSNPMLMS